MTTRKEFQDIAEKHYSKVWTNCDPAVGKSIEKFHAAVTPSHSLTSKKFSLISLVSEHLDQVVDKFMSGFLPDKPELLSKLIKVDPKSKQVKIYPNRADDYLVKAMKKYETDTAIEELDERGDIIRATIDSLRDVVRFCDFFVSEDVKYVSSNEDAMLIPKRTKIGGRPANNLSANFPIYLIFKHRPFCPFCDKFSEQEVEYHHIRSEIIIDGLEDRELKIYELLKKGRDKFREKGLSPTFCLEHNPAHYKTNYNKALKNRKQFYSLILLIIDIRKRIKAQPQDEYDRRVVAYRLLEKYPIKKDISQAAISVADYYEKKDPAEKKAALIEMARLYESFMEWHDEFLGLQENRGEVFILPTL